MAAAAAEGALLLGEEGSLHSHSRMELGGGAHGHGGSGFRGRTPSPREATLQPLPSSTKITGAGPPQHARRTSHTKRSSFGSDLDDDAGEGLTECREDCRVSGIVWLLAVAFLLFWSGLTYSHNVLMGERLSPGSGSLGIQSLGGAHPVDPPWTCQRPVNFH